MLKEPYINKCTIKGVKEIVNGIIKGDVIIEMDIGSVIANCTFDGDVYIIGSKKAPINVLPLFTNNKVMGKVKVIKGYVRIYKNMVQGE